MACKGAITGMVMTAAGGMLTNGAASGVFGAAPISSLAGIPSTITDAATGLSIAPSLATVTSGITGITGGALGTGLSGAVSSMSGAGFSSAMTDAWNGISGNLADGGLFDAVGGFAPDVNSLLTSASGAGSLNNAMGWATEWAGKTVGGAGSLVGGVLTGDAKKFGTILNTASSYIGQANQFINSAASSIAGVGADTFTGMDNLISGGIAGVTEAFSDFGGELGKLGNTLNLDSIGNIGSPGQLLANMDLSGTLGPMYDKVANISVNSKTLNQIGDTFSDFTGNITLGEAGVDLNSVAKLGAAMPSSIQKQVYTAFEELDKTDLNSVKSILGNSQEQIVAGADLFDPKKLFPTTFDTLTAPLRTASVGFKSIYTADGAVNGEFNSLGQKLDGIVPEDIAVASGALALSLGQVQSIGTSNISDLSNTVANLESTKDLTLLEAQTSPVPSGVAEYWADTYVTDSATGVKLATGNSNQMVLSDVIGFAAGYNSAAPLTQNATVLEQMATAGELDDITGTQGVYDTINKFCAGDFGPTTPGVSFTWEVVIPVGYVGEGTYGAATSAEAFELAWVNGIIPATITILNGFASNENAQVVVRNSKRISDQLAREYLNQTRLDNEDLGAVRATDDAALNMAQNLPNYGLDTTEGGSAELLERIVDFSSLGGQAIVGAMREGRNIQRLGNANIGQNIAFDTEGVQNQGTLLTSQYTTTEAKNRVIRS